MGDITTAFVKQFGSNVDMLVQQKGSRLRNVVRLESGVTGEKAFFEQLASTAAIKKTTRNSDTPLIKSDHRRRMVTMYDYEWADLLDSQDKLKMLIDPTNDYAVNAAWALGRSLDDAIYDAARGTAMTGKEGTTSTVLPAGQKVAVGATGLTLAKLLSAKQILDTADVDPAEERFIVVNAKMIIDLLNTTEVKSADYNTVKALASGQLDTFLGFKFILFNRLDTVTTTDYAIVWAKSGLLLATAQDISSRIDQRADKGYATQVYVKMGIGATRMEEEKVVEIACLNT